MLDRGELCKHFTDDQINDLLDLEELCKRTKLGRIRRSRVRKVDPNHIPRPINSFMFYRLEKQALIRKFCPTANHRVISKMVAKWWHSLSSSQKASYVEQAQNAKAAHTEKYPDYTFCPKPKRVTAKKPLCIKIVPETDIRKMKTENIGCEQTTPAQPSSLVPAIDRCQLPQNTNDVQQQLLQLNAYYANFNCLSNHGNVQPTQTICQAGGDYSNQIFSQHPMSNQLFPGPYPSHMSQDLHHCHQQPLPVQFMPSLYPMQAPQGFHHRKAISYYPSPVDKAPSMTIMQDKRNPVPNSNSSNNSVHHVSSTPLLDDEITPLSQTMSTPVLGYASSPFASNAGKANMSPQYNSAKDINGSLSCFYEDFSLYSDMFPAVCDPQSTLLEDFSFLESSSN